MINSHEIDSCYIALQCAHFEPEMAQALTPSMMAWDDECWLLDLTPCLSYWRMEACRARLTKRHALPQDKHHEPSSPALNPIDLFSAPPREALTETEPSIETAVIARHLLDHIYKQGYRAAISRDPWRALLLAAIMNERELTGLIDGEGRLGRNIYRSMSWDVWTKEVKRVLDLVTAGGHTKGPLQKARTQLVQLLQLADRLALSTPLALPNVSYDSFRRRYGDILAGIWRRSFADEHPALRTEEMHPAQDDFPGGSFPWRSYRFEEPVQRQRHLDFPVAQWEQLAPLLREDLFLLCSIGSLPEQYRVLLMDWEIVLDDMSCVPVPILFRHPHDLHSESPHFSTTLLQAHYAFQGAMNRICDGEREYSPCLQAVVSWRLKVSHKLLAIPQIVDIFGTRQSAYGTLVELENRLAVPLLTYEQSSQWQPEDSYCEMASLPTGTTHFSSKPPSSKKSSSKKSEETKQTGLPLTLMALARQRPLFFHKKPIALEPGAWQGKPRFLERVMGKWWDPSKERQAPRDYYLARGERQRLLWIYRDGFGKWYEHGLFH